MKRPGHAVRRNTFLSLLISGIGYLYPLLVFIYIARIFRPEGLGRISFASSVAAYFVMFTGLGMPIYGLRAVAACQEDLQERSQLMAEMLLIRFLSGIAVWCAFLLAMCLLTRQDEQNLLMIYGFGILAAIPECSWFYKGMEDYRTLAWISAAGRMGGLILVFLFVRQAADIRTYAWIAVLIPWAVSIMELIWADRKWNLHIIRQCWRLTGTKDILRTAYKHIRPLMLFMLMSCAVIIYTHTDAVMLGLMQNERVVGMYSCAAKIKSLLPVLTGTLWAAALPKAAELWKAQKRAEFTELADKSFHVIYMVMLPLAIYFFLFAEPWIYLIGGGDYLDAVWTMRLLLLAVIPIGFSNIIGGQMLISTGYEGQLFRAEAVGAGCNIVLNALLIPLFSSAGASIATTISETLVMLIAMRAMRKIVVFHPFQPENLLCSLIGCAAAGLLSLGIVSNIRLPLLVKAPISFAVYFLLFGFTMLLFRDSLYRDLFKAARKLYRRVVPEMIRFPLGKMTRTFRAMFYRMETALFPDRMNMHCPCCDTRLRSFVAGEYLDNPESFDRRRYEKTRQDVICPVRKLR